MSEQIFASLLTVLVIGLFIGTNLGVLLMALMRMASPEPDPEQISEFDRRAKGNARLN